MSKPTIMTHDEELAREAAQERIKHVTHLLATAERKRLAEPLYQIEHGPCGDSIERIDDSSSGLVECPGCGADVPWETIREGRCPECH